MSIVHKIGRRKTSVARVYVKPGTGNVTVNGKDAKTYFCTDVLVYKVNQPFLLTETVGQYEQVRQKLSDLEYLEHYVRLTRSLELF